MSHAVWLPWHVLMIGGKLIGVAITDSLTCPFQRMLLDLFLLLSKSSYVFEERRWFSLPVEQVQFKTLWGEFHSMQAETVLLPLFSGSLSNYNNMPKKNMRKDNLLGAKTELFIF